MLKKQKAENRNGCKNRKTGRFEYKNRKIDLKNDQNSKTENPNAPLSDKSRATLKLKRYFDWKLKKLKKSYSG